MDDKCNPYTSSLRLYANSLTAPVHTQEKTYGGVIAETLDQLRASGLSPEQMAPSLDEIVDHLAMAILGGKGGIINNRR
ncbi:hypothetical protein LJC15_03540 [Desulfovibrio sp. OttesenSCG-928-G11]|nr:hypothetical protein [Desulfovibrio sp. OttesenSCG-928-G11]